MHSVFLKEFLPVKGLPDDGFGGAFMNPPLLWTQVFQYLVLPYRVFLIPALSVERKHLWAPVRTPSFTMGLDKKVLRRKGGKAWAAE